MARALGGAFELAELAPALVHGDDAGLGVELVREAMRELNRLLAALEHGELEKVVLTQKNQMRAVLITVERYSELEQHAA